MTWLNDVARAANATARNERGNSNKRRCYHRYRTNVSGTDYQII